MTDIQESLLDLHASVTRLIKVIQDNSDTLSRGDEILDKLPLLDFYNDDLLKNIEQLKGKY